MEKYIQRDALVAKIDRLKKTEWWCQVGKDTADVYYARGFRFACERIISFIDSLEVKEVDLDKEIQDSIYNRFFDLEGIAIAGSSLYATVEDMVYVAKHFFELGLKAQKGE